MTITFYHQDGCGMCKTVEMLLNKKEIKYVSVKDVDEMIKHGVSGTPAIEADGKLYIKKEAFDWVKAQ